MRLFVAIESLGENGDFAFTVPGELVHLPVDICSCPDCGCDRAMVGLVSRKGTTSFVTREIDVDEATYRDLMLDSLAAAGWVTPDGDASWVDLWTRDHIAMAARFPVETPLRAHGSRMSMRSRSRAG